ncbi:MAG: chemotaxis response regulator protein-glutamate methylesterase [Terriglobales bacterium]
MSASTSPIKVLIADDSAFMRAALARMIASDQSLRVVGTAQTGLEALEKINQLQPDVVTLDIDMPGLNGLETLKRVMSESPRPVIMVSSLTQKGAETTLDALGLGAFDYIPKQLNYISLDIIKVQDELVSKIKAAAHSRMKAPKATKKSRTQPTTAPPNAAQGAPSIIAIGTSTGGPKALQEILPALPGNLPVGVLVVQHMPAGFTGPFAKRLDNLCQVAVHEVEQGMMVEPGHVYLAPAGKHMTVHRSASEVFLQVSRTPSDTLHIPSVDVMMFSVAEVFHGLAMGIILTGMGADGALGMQAIFQAGGLTVGQDEATCAVYGMPRACAEMGVLKRVVTLAEIPQHILSALGHQAG